MASVGKLGSVEGRRTSQGPELCWRGGCCGGYPIGYPGSQRSNGCVWVNPNRVVYLAGDRHAADKHQTGGIKFCLI